MKLIVGLGNPGVRYEATRHNVGFMAIDLIGEELGINFKKSKHNALLAEAFFKEQKILIAKPLTYMNLSGEAVSSLVNWYKISTDDLIIVYDDMDLDVGRLRIRGRGSAGGQRGMASIIQTLGTDNLTRVRIGVGRPPEGFNPANHVLSIFSEDEWETMRKILFLAAEATLALTWEGLDQVMNKYNK